MPHSDEADLIRRARRDRSAFALLYDRHVRRVYQFIYRRTGDEAVAQDLTSATFEKALQHIGRFRWQGVGFGAWLYRIARNEVTQHYRRQKRSAPVLEWRVLDAGAFSPNGRHDSLHAAIEGLTEADRAVLTLRFFDDLSSAETAEVLGVSVANVYVRLHRALARLRRALEKIEATEADHAR